MLLDGGHRVHLIISKSACLTAKLELETEVSKPRDFLKGLPSQHAQRVCIYANSDFSAAIASGSFRINGTLIIPCSMTTLGAIANGVCDNLIRRSADVALKERFPLVIVPREAPFSAIHLENMLKLSRLGAHIFPPVPMWYAKPPDLLAAENGIVARALQLLNIEVDPRFFRPWGQDAKS